MKAFPVEEKAVRKKVSFDSPFVYNSKGFIKEVKPLDIKGEMKILKQNTLKYLAEYRKKKEELWRLES